MTSALHHVAAFSTTPSTNDRIGIYGTSFGAGIAVIAAKYSELPRAAVLAVPVSSGSQWLQRICRWHEFLDLKKRAMAAIQKKTRTGTMEMVDRYEIMLPDPLTRERFKDPSPLALENFYHIIQREPLFATEDLRIPVAVIGVKSDPLVPFDQTLSLFERLPGQKELHLLESATHFGIYEHSLRNIAQIATAWLDEHLLRANAAR